MRKTELNTNVKLKSLSLRKCMFVRQSSTTLQAHLFSCRFCLISPKEPFLSVAINTLKSSISAFNNIPHNPLRGTSTFQKRESTPSTQATHQEGLESSQRHLKYLQSLSKKYGKSTNSNLLRTCCDQARKKKSSLFFPPETSLTQISSGHKRFFGCSRTKDFIMKCWACCARENSSTGLSGTSHFGTLTFPPSVNSQVLLKPMLWTLLLLNISLITPAARISLPMKASPPSEMSSSRRVTSDSWWDQSSVLSLNLLRLLFAIILFFKIVSEKLTKFWRIWPLNSAKPLRFSMTTWAASLIFPSTLPTSLLQGKLPKNTRIILLSHGKNSLMRPEKLSIPSNRILSVRLR